MTITLNLDLAKQLVDYFGGNEELEINVGTVPYTATGIGLYVHPEGRPYDTFIILRKEKGE